MEMQPFNFKVIRTDDESSHVPVSVAGQTMVDVQRLLTDIGSLMLRRELRMQGPVPEELLRRFSLSMELSSGKDVNAVTEGEDTLMLDALNQLMRELDLVGIGSRQEEPENHMEALARNDIARDILALNDHLDGFTLSYGKDGSMKKFRIANRGKLESEVLDGRTSFPGAAIGVIRADPVRRNRWLMYNDVDGVPIRFGPNIAPSDIPIFAESGPLIASGTVVTDGKGKVIEMKDVVGCYSFPSVKFHRAITAERDIVLLNPVEAVPGYNSKKGLWTLDNEDLGISVSKPSWDACAAAFHEYFVFLWETYVETDGDFEGEELEIRDFLRSLAFP